MTGWREDLVVGTHDVGPPLPEGSGGAVRVTHRPTGVYILVALAEHKDLCRGVDRALTLLKRSLRVLAPGVRR